MNNKDGIHSLPVGDERPSLPAHISLEPTGSDATNPFVIQADSQYQHAKDCLGAIQNRGLHCRVDEQGGTWSVRIRIRPDRYTLVYEQADSFCEAVLQATTRLFAYDWDTGWDSFRQGNLN